MMGLNTGHGIIRGMVITHKLRNQRLIQSAAAAASPGHVRRASTTTTEEDTTIT